MEYFPWEHDSDNENLAWLHEKEPDAVSEDSWRWTTGESIASWFPNDVTFDLSKNHGIELADSIPNTMQGLVISEKLKAVLAASGASFEFFPIKIRNHKMKVIPQPYFFANLVGLLACTDMTRSEYSLSHIDGLVRRFRRLVLDESRIPESAQIFRLAERPELYVVSKPLGIKIAREEKCTGLSLTYIEDFGKEWRGA